MFALISNHPLAIGSVLLLVDLAVWHSIAAQHRIARLATRATAFVLFSWVLNSTGMSPLTPAPWPDDATLNMVATLLEIVWWLFAARLLTVILGAVLFQRGHTGRLLQDVMGAVIFLIAIVAAAAYVMQLPVKGLLATSGAMAIIVGLALQSTLSDVFSGIVLNTTKPYQLDDWISIDGTEGKVVDIDWRATHLMTSNGAMAVIPNSVAAKAKILNFSRPSNIHGVSISIAVPSDVRPRKVLDALEKALQGTTALLISPKPKVAVKASTLEYMEYEATGFIRSMDQKTDAQNLLFDLAHRHLQASGVSWAAEDSARPWTRQRAVLEDVRVFRSLNSDEKDRLAEHMTPVEYPEDQLILAYGAASEDLLVIGTGVVSASIKDGEKMIEAGRLGPGEILGEDNLVSEGNSLAQFRALTTCMLYRIDKQELKACMAERSEVLAAFTKLQHYRQHKSQSLLMQKPADIRKGGFLNWLHIKP
ncbi:mechanosensitive ion channel domain-containing protein [Pseudomonas sp.]|uniref:mechanosensitive ion channel domain-containing protein n=1 Tax=Pseudomonas sp. TaxID=306 RepID=UPI003CC5BBB4